MAKLMWFQTGSCSGDTMALPCAERPSLEMVARSAIDLLWHPSLSLTGGSNDLDRLLHAIETGQETVDILCIEGSITGPYGSGRFDRDRRPPKMNIVRRLADKAGVVVAMGTCAALALPAASTICVLPASCRKR